MIHTQFGISHAYLGFQKEMWDFTCLFRFSKGDVKWDPLIYSIYSNFEIPTLVGPVCQK